MELASLSTDFKLGHETSIPAQCLVPLLFKLDAKVRKSFGRRPNTAVRHKAMFGRYWRKVIDQDCCTTEHASFRPASVWAPAPARIQLDRQSAEAAQMGVSLAYHTDDGAQDAAARVLEAIEERKIYSGVADSAKIRGAVGRAGSHWEGQYDAS